LEVASKSHLEKIVVAHIDPVHLPDAWVLGRVGVSPAVSGVSPET
jgi:hypothetical protein